MAKRKAAIPPTIMPTPRRSPRCRLRVASSLGAFPAAALRPSAPRPPGRMTVHVRYQAGTAEARMTATPIMSTVSPMSSLTRTRGTDQAVTAPQRRSTKATEA